MAIQINEVQNTTYEVDGKVYKTEEEALAAIAALENVGKGYKFVEATTPELSDRARRTKANLIGEYLDWLADGSPELTEEEVAERVAKEEERKAKLAA